MNRISIRILQILLPVAVLAVAGFAAVILVRSRPPVETQPPLFEPPGVRVHQVASRDVPMTVISQGTVSPRTESQLVPEITGRVIRVAASFAEGGFFEAGDMLVEIDPFDYQQAVVAARSQLAQKGGDRIVVVSLRGGMFSQAEQEELAKLLRGRLGLMLN